MTVPLAMRIATLLRAWIVARFMLDTNTVSHLLRGQPAVVAAVTATSIGELCISAVTEGELRFGLARRPGATRLAALVREFLARVSVEPWDSDVAQRYGTLRADNQALGVSLSDLDMMIAGHAYSLGLVLVTSDKAFRHIRGLEVEDWAER